MGGMVKVRGQRTVVKREGKLVTLSCGHVIERPASRPFKSAVCPDCRRAPQRAGRSGRLGRDE